MKCVLRCWLMAALSAAHGAWAEGFDSDQPGSPPSGWTCGSAGPGIPTWTVRRDATAPSGPHALLQSGTAAFPWCVKDKVTVLNGYVETKFKPIDGRQDQAGGIIWRWRDANRYYVARANALENNVALYYVEQGKRQTLKYVAAPVPAQQWSTLRAEFFDIRIRVYLNGQLLIELHDDHIPDPGTLGVWTKADSITAFDDFSYGTAIGNK